MTDEIPRDDDRQSDLAVMDVDEYKQKRRLERIYDVHDMVGEIATDSLNERAYHDLSSDGEDIAVLHAVQRFIWESYNMLIEYAEGREDGGTEDKYWTGEGRDNPLGEIRFKNSETVEFWGLKDVLQAKRVYSKTWTETTHPRDMAPREETHENQKTVPRRVSVDAYLLLKEFLEKERDLDLNFEGGGDSWEV